MNIIEYYDKIFFFVIIIENAGEWIYNTRVILWLLKVYFVSIIIEIMIGPRVWFYENWLLAKVIGFINRNFIKKIKKKSRKIKQFQTRCKNLSMDSIANHFTGKLTPIFFYNIFHKSLDSRFLSSIIIKSI